jgi:hypothetical protein
LQLWLDDSSVTFEPKEPPETAFLRVEKLAKPVALLFPPAWRNRTGRTSSALRDGIDCVLNGFGKTPLAGKLPSFPLGSKRFLSKAICL